MLQNIHIRHVRYMYTCQQVLRPQVQVQVQVQVPSTHLWKFLLTIPITQLTVLAVAADLMH